MTDTRTAERVLTIGKHRPYGLDCKCGRPINSDEDWAEHVAAALAPQLDEQITDTYLLAVGSCIALIDATTAAALAQESERNRRVIAEWAAKVTTAMRYASAGITPGGGR